MYTRNDVSLKLSKGLMSKIRYSFLVFPQKLYITVKLNFFIPSHLFLFSVMKPNACSVSVEAIATVKARAPMESVSGKPKDPRAAIH